MAKRSVLKGLLAAACMLVFTVSHAQGDPVQATTYSCPPDAAVAKCSASVCDPANYPGCDAATAPGASCEIASCIGGSLSTGIKVPVCSAMWRQADGSIDLCAAFSDPSEGDAGEGAGVSGSGSGTSSGTGEETGGFQGEGAVTPINGDGCVCPMFYAPVCGEDGKTYGNACEASCAKATVVARGPCFPTCPEGAGTATCLVDPCATAAADGGCKADPTATCRYSTCSEALALADGTEIRPCEAVWVRANTGLPVDCSGDPVVPPGGDDVSGGGGSGGIVITPTNSPVRCPSGVQVTPCLVNPCAVPPAGCGPAGVPGAQCFASYCMDAVLPDGTKVPPCSPVYVLPDGKVATCASDGGSGGGGSADGGGGLIMPNPLDGLNPFEGCLGNVRCKANSCAQPRCAKAAALSSAAVCFQLTCTGQSLDGADVEPCSAVWVEPTTKEVVVCGGGEDVTPPAEEVSCPGGVTAACLVDPCSVLSSDCPWASKLGTADGGGGEVTCEASYCEKGLLPDGSVIGPCTAVFRSAADNSILGTCPAPQPEDGGGEALDPFAGCEGNVRCAGDPCAAGPCAAAKADWRCFPVTCGGQSLDGVPVAPCSAVWVDPESRDAVVCPAPDTPVVDKPLVRCPPGSPIAMCIADPCAVPPPDCPFAKTEGAKCTPNYCAGGILPDGSKVGPCAAVYTLPDGTIGACPKPKPATNECVCTLEWAPVCGSDGKTYGNKCMAECELPPGGSYKPGECGSSDPEPPTCVCTTLFAPVCGSDGKTYPNACSAACVLGDKGKWTDGECDGGSGSGGGGSDPVGVTPILCPSGVQVSPCMVNPCAAPPPAGCPYAALSSAQCYSTTCLDGQLADGTKVPPCTAVYRLFDGSFKTCPPQPQPQPPSCGCTKEYIPVCGSNNVTYGNKCMAACELGPDGQWSDGPCPAKPKPICKCTKEYMPVCGVSNNVTYGNKCMAACELGTGEGLWTDGPCGGTKPGGEDGCMCIELYKPVCGADGKTYGNSCQAGCAKVEVVHAGVCAPKCPPGPAAVCAVNPCHVAKPCAADPPVAACTYTTCTNASYTDWQGVETPVLPCAPIFLDENGEVIKCGGSGTPKSCAACPTDYSPVCATGWRPVPMTFPNRCAAECAGATVQKAGKCEHCNGGECEIGKKNDICFITGKKNCWSKKYSCQTPARADSVPPSGTRVPVFGLCLPKPPARHHHHHLRHHARAMLADSEDSAE